MNRFIFDLQRFDAVTINAGETYALDGVTYTAQDDAQLNLDDDGKVSGIASGSVTATVTDAETSPTVTLDATDGAFNFTATSNGEVITITPFPIEFISGEFTYTGGRLSITAGSDLAFVTQRGDYVLRNENHFLNDSAYIFTATSLTSDAEHVISKFSLTNGTDTRELNLEQLGPVVNNFDESGFTLVQGSSEVLNLGNYKLTATASNADAGLNMDLGEAGLTFVPNTGDGTLTVVLTRNGNTIFGGELECTNGSITLGYDHAVTFAKDTSFNFTTPNNTVLTVTATDEATTNIALTDNGITFTPGTGDGGLNIAITKKGSQVFAGTLNITDGTITFDTDEKRFSFTDGTKIRLGIGELEMGVEVVGDTTVGSSLGTGFKIEVDANGNLIFTPDETGGSFNISLKRAEATLLQNSSMLTASSTDDNDAFFENNVTVNGPVMFNPETSLLTLKDGTEISLAFKNYTLSATAQGDAASTISLAEDGISITPDTTDGGKLNLVLSGANGTVSVDVAVLSGGFFLGSDGSLKILSGTKTTLTLGDYEINLTADSDTTFGVSLGTDGTINITSPENNGSVDISIASGGSTIFNNTININGTVSFNPEDQTVNLTDGTKISLTLPDIEVRLDIEVADGDASGKISLNDGKFLYTPDEDGKALNIGLTLLQNDGTDFMTIPVNLETTNGSLGIDFVNKSFVFSKGNSFTINLGEYIVGAEIVDDDANISIESSGDGNFKITPGKDDGSIKVNLTRAADSQTIFAGTVKIDGSISVEGTAGTLDAGTTVSITQGDYEINFTVTGDDGIVLAPYGTTGFILISPKSSNVALDASLKRNGEAILNGNLKLNRPIYYNPANNLFEMDSKTKFVTTIGNYEITLGTDSTLLVAYFNIEDDRFIITPLEGNRYNTAVVSIARDGTTIIDSLKIKLSEGSLIFDAANLSFGFGDGTEITTTFGDYNVTATAKGEARVSFAITDSDLTVTPASGDGTLDITLSKGDEELLTANVEVLSGAFILGENGTLTLKDGTATKITFGNYTLNVTAQGDATSTIAFSAQGLSITPNTTDNGKLNLTLGSTAGSMSADIEVLSGGFLFGANGALNVVEGTELQIKFSDDYIVNFKTTDAAGGALSIDADGIKFAPNAEDGSLELSVTRNGETRTTSLDVTGSLTYKLDGSISLAEGTVVKNVFEDGNILTITANTDATGSIVFSPQDGVTITPAEADALNVLFTSGDIDVFNITSINGSVNYKGGVITATDGTEARFTNYYMESEMLLSTTGGSASIIITEDTTSYVANTGATFVLDYLDGTTLEITGGKFTDDYEHAIITEGSVFRTNDDEDYFVLETAGNYTLNGMNITTTADNVQVVLSGYDTIEFEANAGIVFDGQEFSGEGTVTLSDGSITLGEGSSLIKTFDSGNVVKVTANVDDCGTITVTDNGITVTPSAADAMTVQETFTFGPVYNLTNIEGTFAIDDNVFKFTDGAVVSGEVTVGGNNRGVNFSASDGEASVEVFNAAMNYIANDGATLSTTVGEDVIRINGGGTVASAVVNGVHQISIDNGINISADTGYTFTLDADGSYTLNGMNVTATSDNVQVQLRDYDTVELGEDTKINLTTSLSGSDLDLTIEGQGSVTLGESGEITCDATDSALEITMGLEDVIGESILPNVFNISGGTVTTSINAADGTKNISITKGTTLSFTRNGMTFNAVAQNDIDGRLWLREGNILYLHSYEEALFDATITFAGNAIFSGTVTLGGAFSYNAATGTVGSVDSNTYNVHDSYLQVALGNHNIKFTTNGDTFFAALKADDNGKMTFDFINEKYNSMLLEISTGDNTVLNSALAVKGAIVIDPATQEISLPKDTVLTFTQGGRDLEITALEDAGGKLSMTDDGIRFALNAGDGALELNFVDTNRKATLDVTGAILLRNDGQISLEDGTEINLAWTDGNSLKLTSSGSTGSIALDADKGLKITSADENLDLELTMAYGYSTKVSGIKGSLWYKSGVTTIEEGTKLTGTGTLGGNEVVVTLEAIDGDAYLDFSTSSGFVYGAGSGKLKVTYALGDLESTFIVNSGSVLFGNDISIIAEGTDLATDLKDFIPALTFTTSEAGTYTINGQTITTSAEGLALTATDDQMVFKTSGDVVSYEGMTFAGSGNVSLKPSEVVLGAGVEATGFGEGNSFVLAEAGNVTADAKIFELSKIEGTPREIPMIITVTGAQDGFTFSRTLTKESEAYLDDALTDEAFENYSSSYIGQVFTEKFISAGDSSYRIRTDAIGLEDVIGISDGATVTGGASLSDEPTLSYYDLVTDTEGTFTIGEKSYNVSGDSSVAITARFDADGSAYASKIDSLNGTVSGDFTGGAFSINGSSGLKVFNDTEVSVAADEDGFEVLGLDAGASLQVSATDTYNVDGMTFNANAGDYIIGLGESSAYLSAVNNDTLLSGTELADHISNTGSNVTITGGAGNDSIRNVLGSNTSILGDDGDDFIYNYAGDLMTADGGAGDDSIYNTADNALLDGGDGADYIVNAIQSDADGNVSVTADNTTINGGDGSDRLVNEYGNAVLIDGGDGADSINNLGSNSTITGGAGDDSIRNSGSNTTFKYSSGDGNDTIVGFNETSTLSIAEEYSTAVSGNDLIVTVGDSRITLIDAASLSSANIESTYQNPIVTLVEAALKRTAAGYPAIAAVAFHPDEDLGDEPTNYSAKEDWAITSADNLKLHAVHYTPEDSNDKWVVLIHGYGHYHNAMYVYAAAYLANSYNVLMIDQRAAGESEGEWLTMGAAESKDVALWTQEIARRNSNAKITLHGVSMGSATAMLAAARSDTKNVTSLVEDCGYTNVVEVFNLLNEVYIQQPPEVIAAMDIVAESLTGYYLHDAAPIDSISSAKMPTMFITGDADTVVPISMLSELYEASGADVKETFIVEGAAHANAVVDDSIGYNNAVFRFVAEADGEGWNTSNTTDNISLRGTSYDDNITNSGTNVTIQTSEGNDTIVNNVDSSVTTASLGNLIEAGAGDDYIYSHHSYHPTLLGGEGDDSIVVSRGHMTFIDGGAGSDTILGQGTDEASNDWAMGGHATLLGGDGNDYISPGYTNDSSIDGGDGNDTIITTGVNITITGGAGDDSIIAESFDSETSVTMDGGDGDDLLQTGATNTTMIGGKGSDTFRGGAGLVNCVIADYTEGEDIIYHGRPFADLSINGSVSGNDYVIAAGTRTITVKDSADKVITVVDSNGDTRLFGKYLTLDDNDPATVTAQAGVATIDASKRTTDIEITGNDANNTIISSAGNCTLTGGKGKDTFVRGNRGVTQTIVIADYTEGEDEIYHGRPFAAFSLLDIAEADGDDYVFNTSGATIKYLDGADKKIKFVDVNGDVAYFGNYLTIRDFDSDTLTATDKVKVLDASERTKGIQLTGNSLDNTILGGTGNDTLNGGDGNDTIIGGGGKDIIDGGDGKNLIKQTDTDDGALIVLNGQTTVEGFKTGFGDGTDTIYIDGDPAGVYFKSGGLTFSNSTDSLTLSDVTTTAKVNIYHERRSVLNKGVFIADNDWYSVESGDLSVRRGEEVYFVGPSATPNHGVDFSGISSALNVTMDTAYIDSEDYVPGTSMWINGVYSLKGGAGRTTVTGSDKSDTIIAGTGATTIDGAGGNDKISLGSAQALVKYTAGDGSDLIQGFNENSTLSIAGDEFSSTTRGKDLILTVGDDKITLAGAADLEDAHIIGTSSDGSDTQQGGGDDTQHGGGSSSSTTGGGGSSSTTSSGSSSTSPIYNYHSTPKANSDPSLDMIMAKANATAKAADSYTYTGGDQVIANYVSEQKITLGSFPTGYIFNDGNFALTSDSGSLIIQDAYDKVIDLRDGAGNAFAKAYAATNAGLIDGRGIAGFEVIAGSDNGSDMIYAGDNGSSLWGGNGLYSDTLVGGGGTDIFVGGKLQGADTFVNASASDVVFFSDATLGDVIATAGNDNAVAVAFNTGNVVLVGSSDTISAAFMLADGSAYRYNHTSKAWQNA